MTEKTDRVFRDLNMSIHVRLRGQNEEDQHAKIGILGPLEAFEGQKEKWGNEWWLFNAGRQIGTSVRRE
jgi:hypothetical protein